jgi:GTPase SAR1 family protein
MANAKDAHATSTPKILLLGDTGAGKTTQVLTLPGRKFAYLFDPKSLQIYSRRQDH